LPTNIRSAKVKNTLAYHGRKLFPVLRNRSEVDKLGANL